MECTQWLYIYLYVSYENIIVLFNNCSKAGEYVSAQTWLRVIVKCWSSKCFPKVVSGRFHQVFVQMYILNMIDLIQWLDARKQGGASWLEGGASIIHL